MSSPAAEHERFLTRFLQVQDGLRAAVHAIVGDPHLADDLFQETAIACWRSYATYDESASFAAWARGVLRHIIASHWRRQGRAGQSLPLEVAEAVMAVEAPVAPSDQRLDALRSCLQALSPRVRQLLALHYGEDLDRESLAARLQTSAEAVKKALFRARTALATCVEQRLAGGGRR